MALKLQPGDTAPRYDPAEVTQLGLQTAVITEKGTESELPIVDLQMIDATGKKYFVAMTGRIAMSLAGAIRGVNERNHGNPEP